MLLNNKKKQGFTLIELSIVLVILGLLVGAILVGRQMIYSAQLRKILTEKDKYTVAANTFKIKYQSLPGDMSPSQSSMFGFFTFEGLALPFNYGNNDGLIRTVAVERTCLAECGAFWTHLSQAGLISFSPGPLETGLNTGCAGAPIGQGTASCNQYVQSDYLPRSPIGPGFWFAASFPNLATTLPARQANWNKNLFSISIQEEGGNLYQKPALSGMDVYSLDSKIDDGMPNTGKVLAASYDPDDGSGYWWSFTVDADSEACTTGGSGFWWSTDVVYNTDPNTGGDKLTCIPVFSW